MAIVHVKIHGIDTLMHQLDALASAKTARKIQRRAGTAAIRPMTQAAVDLCPVGLKIEGDDHPGALRASIDSQITTRRGHVSAIVGCNTAVLMTGKKAQYKDEGPRAARHLHLVLFGHVDSKSGVAVPGNNFLQAAFEETQAHALETYADKVREGLELAVDEHR